MHTTRGVVHADQVLIATSGYTGSLTPWLRRRTIPVGSFIIVTEPLGVLMETAPAGLNVDELVRALGEVDGVSEVHELHVWNVTTGFVALSAHVVVAADPLRQLRQTRATAAPAAMPAG
mgnify:CR=1 FL=1